MRSLKNTAVLLFITCICIPAMAAGTATGKVVGFIPYSIGTEEAFFIKIENLTGTPACNSSGRLLMKSSDLKFKSTQAALLAAFMSGTQVLARGIGSCNAYPNSEDLAYVCLGETPC